MVSQATVICWQLLCSDINVEQHCSSTAVATAATSLRAKADAISMKVYTCTRMPTQHAGAAYLLDRADAAAEM